MAAFGRPMGPQLGKKRKFPLNKEKLTPLL